MNEQNTKPQAPLYVIAYDITDNKERHKVDEVLKGYGFRVQKSVYECHLTRGAKKQLYGELRGLEIVSGHIRCYGVTGKITKIGKPQQDIDEEFIYFIE